jgi:exodeoxyribonuclease VII large subunit
MASYSLFENPAKTEPVITVSALNQAVARLLEQNFPLTWISGEISNFTRAASGHWYFTLKDQDAQVRAVMFRGRAQYAAFTPREGDKVEVRALAGLYTPRGDYQINVEAIRRAGLGSLYETFLRLKAQLESEGLFDAEKKKNIPVFVKRIAIVTSPNAAALRDVLTALKRRAPHVEVCIYPSPVQGEGAAAKIAQAIATASANPSNELLIVCRGGGSIEDLWAFNEEIVARTIAHCEIPVISGVGHETDFTIADFVADLRAPTPTAAAELATTAQQDWLTTLEHQRQRLHRLIHRQIQTQTQQLDWTARRLISPIASIASKRQSLHINAQHLRLALQVPAQRGRARLQQLQQRLQQQKPQLAKSKVQVAGKADAIKVAMNQFLQQRHVRLAHLQEQLELLNPQRTLERGYIILSQSDGSLIRSGTQLHPDQHLLVRTAVDLNEVQLKQVGKPQKL